MTEPIAKICHYTDVPAQVFGDPQQPERPRPEIHGREIIDPGINEKTLCFHT